MEIKNYKGILFFDEKGNKDTLLAKGNDFQEIILKTENFKFIEPIAFDESMYQFAETEKAIIIGVFLRIALFYKKGITIRYEDSNNNVVAEYKLTEKNVFSEKMNQIVTLLREGSEKDFAIEVELITLALENKIWDTKEIKTDFVKDKDMPEQTAYEQIDFLSPSTEELDTVIKSMQYNSDGLTLIESRKAIVFIGETALSVNFQKEKGNNRIFIVKKDLTGKLFESPIITNESLLEIQEIYYILLKQILDYLKTKPDEKIEPKFKVGDRVKLPTTKNGKKLVNNVSVVWDDARKIGQDYLVVNEVFDNNIVLNNEYGKFGDYFEINLDKIELYTTKQPQPKFKVGDRVTFNLVPFATFKVMEKPNYNGARGKFVYKLQNEDGRSSFSSGYEDVINLIVDETPMDCDADPNLIVSGQVKAFYDLNKNRIDKLNSKFSCKIIKALVSLSEYEKCGSPSSATVTKAKTDLLSKISKLKV